MSETLWGVVIGGLIVIAGSIVAGLFQKHQTRVTIEAQRQQQIRQFEFDAEQRTKQFAFEKDQTAGRLAFDNDQLIIARAIEERKKWIPPLKASLTHYSRCATSVQNAFINHRWCEVDETFQALNTSMNEWRQATIALCTDTAQISDPILKHLVVSLRKDTYLVSINDKQAEKQLALITQNVSDTFKRIEDLLCGK